MGFYLDGNYNYDHPTIKIMQEKKDLFLPTFCESELEKLKGNIEDTNKQNNLVLDRHHICQHSKQCYICTATVDPLKIEN